MAPLKYHKNLNCHVNATDTFNLSTRKFLVFVLKHPTFCQQRIDYSKIKVTMNNVYLYKQSQFHNIFEKYNSQISYRILEIFKHFYFQILLLFQYSLRFSSN